MRKKTALRTPKQRETSLHQQGGLIVRGKIPQQSATAQSTLTNRSHRTTSIGKLRSIDEAVRQVNQQVTQAEHLDAILVVPSIPKLPAGKIDRVRARDLLQERLTANGMV